MGRKVYNDCMKPYISGQHEDRRMDFCIGAKICSGKAKTPEEARKLCLEAPPVAPKARVRKRIDLVSLAACAVKKIDFASLTPENMQPTLAAALQSCSGAPSPSYKRFMSACMKEIGTGDFKTSQPDIKKCQLRWGEVRGGL